MAVFHFFGLQIYNKIEEGQPGRLLSSNLQKEHFNQKILKQNQIIVNFEYDKLKE